jgi:hypothetical protein
MTTYAALIGPLVHIRRQSWILQHGQCVTYYSTYPALTDPLVYTIRFLKV